MTDKVQTTPYYDIFSCFRIADLELAVDRMKQQQENLQKRLKEESDRKVKLEVQVT